MLVRTTVSGQMLSASDSADEAAGQHQHMQMAMGSGWQFMQDGVLFGVLNHQGGEHGSNGATAPNWWMGMAMRKVGASQLTLNGMFSLDPATVGTDGYAEIFQVGEVVNNQPLINRQHPHDLFMQLAAIWRTPVSSNTGITIAGGPVGEPALGPVAFMHRASIAEYPFAPLSHHTFDSTHVSFGVVTAAIDHGQFVLEGSVFNGREPDQNRWDFDFGPLDSVAGRLWYRPNDQWEFQASTGHLTQPEALDPANVQRTTVTGSWITRNGSDFDAISFGWGVNVAEGVSRNAVYFEATHHLGENSVFTRLETLQLETDLLLTDTIPTTPAAIALKSPVGAFTFGGVHDVVEWRGLEGGIGAAVTFYAVPDALQSAYGSHPVSFQVYLRIRPPVGKMGRMWNMRMSQPMAGHRM
jgi:hypothetical protein